MPEQLAWILLIAILCSAAVMYAWLISERVHERRVRGRLDETIHLTAVVRTSLAQRRGNA
jgi:hypothetical protein